MASSAAGDDLRDRVFQRALGQDPRQGRGGKKADYPAIGIRCSSHKELLGMWIEQTESAKFWLRVMCELKARGTQVILTAVIDSQKGFPETEIQTCIAHLIRYSMQFASWTEHITSPRR